jgi:hypothetical protein
VLNKVIIYQIYLGPFPSLLSFGQIFVPSLSSVNSLLESTH